MGISYKVESVSISAVRDRAMFNTFANNNSYVIKGIGSELEVAYSSQSFVVTLGTGEAVICGGSMLCDTGEIEITLGENESGYLVIEIDLAQTGANVCQFKNVASLVQTNINDGVNTVYDLPLYRYTTSSSGVQSLVDIRTINNSSEGLIELTALIDSMPLTINDARITEDDIVVYHSLSNPSVQTSDWDVITSNGSLQVNGSISGTTSLTLCLAKRRT